MLIPRALLAPHLPTLLVDEHRRHRTPMLEVLSREGERLRGERPEIIVVLSARWESSGPFQVDCGKFHLTLTDDPRFGVEARYDCPGHPGLGRALVDAGIQAGVRVGPAERGVDSGASVPLHFLAPARDLPVVPLSIARRAPAECRAWGEVIRRVLEARPERIGFVVGGMLSHATHAWNFRREVPEASALDEQVLEALSTGAWSEIHPRDPRLVEKAQPEADLCHLEVLRGFLGADLPGQVLCYDPEPGMGAALVAFDVPGAVSVWAARAADEAVSDWRGVRPVDRRGAPPRRERREDMAPVSRAAAGSKRALPSRRRRAAGPAVGRQGTGRGGTRPTASGRPPTGGSGPRRAAAARASSARSGAGRTSRGPRRGASAGSRTPTPRGRARGPRPARKRRG